MSLPAARRIMAAISQTFCSPFSAALSFTSRSVNFGTQIGNFGFCVPAGRRLSSRSRSTLAHKSVFSGFVCQLGAVSQVSRGQLWHTNRFFRVLCARPALPPEILEGKNEKFLAHKLPKFEIVCHTSSNLRRKMKNFWHTNRPNSKSCATPPQTSE